MQAPKPDVGHFVAAAGVEVGMALLDAMLLTVSATSEAAILGLPVMTMEGATGGVQSNKIALVGTGDVMTVFVGTTP